MSITIKDLYGLGLIREVVMLIHPELTLVQLTSLLPKLHPCMFVPKAPKVTQEQKQLIYALEQEYFLKPPGVDSRPVFKFGGPWVITESEWNTLCKRN